MHRRRELWDKTSLKDVKTASAFLFSQKYHSAPYTANLLLGSSVRFHWQHFNTFEVSSSLTLVTKKSRKNTSYVGPSAWKSNTAVPVLKAYSPALLNMLQTQIPYFSLGLDSTRMFELSILHCTAALAFGLITLHGAESIVRRNIWERGRDSKESWARDTMVKKLGPICKETLFYLSLFQLLFSIFKN